MMAAFDILPALNGEHAADTRADRKTIRHRDDVAAVMDQQIHGTVATASA
jgi:hypothetical protein